MLQGQVSPMTYPYTYCSCYYNSSEKYLNNVHILEHEDTVSCEAENVHRYCHDLYVGYFKYSNNVSFCGVVNIVYVIRWSCISQKHCFFGSEFAGGGPLIQYFCLLKQPDYKIRDFWSCTLVACFFTEELVSAK